MMPTKTDKETGVHRDRLGLNFLPNSSSFIIITTISGPTSSNSHHKRQYILRVNEEEKVETIPDSHKSNLSALSL